MAPLPKPRSLPISSLHASPVCVNLHTEQMIEAIRGSLDEHRAAPGITVALVDSRYYIVDGHARVEAYRRAEFEEINVAEVLGLPSETDVLIEHVRRNLHSAMNPIKVAAAAAWLARAGLENPFKMLGVSPVMATAANVVNRWPAGVITKLSRVLDVTASKLSDVYALPHFFAAFEELTEKVCRGDKNAELQLQDIISHIIQYLESIDDETGFTLPGPDQISALMSQRRQRSVQGSSPAAAAGAPASRAKLGGKGEARLGEGDRGDAVRYNEPLIMPDRNKSTIECTSCGSLQVVDLKTGHVCPVESVAGGMVDVIRDGDGHRSYALSVKALRFLGLDRLADEASPAGCTVVATDRKSELERTIRAAKPTDRFVLIISGSEGAG